MRSVVDQSRREPAKYLTLFDALRPIDSYMEYSVYVRGIKIIFRAFTCDTWEHLWTFMLANSANKSGMTKKACCVI